MPDHSTALQRPAKPYEGFPLFAHATGRRAKKIHGRLHCFGPWADWQAALARYKEQADDLHAGKSPRPKSDEAQLHEIVNAFLTAKRGLVDTDELRQRTWNEYHRACDWSERSQLPASSAASAPVTRAGLAVIHNAFASR